MFIVEMQILVHEKITNWNRETQLHVLNSFQYIFVLSNDTACEILYMYALNFRP